MTIFGNQFIMIMEHYETKGRFEKIKNKSKRKSLHDIVKEKT
jgi:hypothetical protein